MVVRAEPTHLGRAQGAPNAPFPQISWEKKHCRFSKDYNFFILHHTPIFLDVLESVQYVHCSPDHPELSPDLLGPTWAERLGSFFFKNSKCLSFSNILILFIVDQISKNLIVLESPLYKLSIPHKDGPFQPTSGLTRIVI